MKTTEASTVEKDDKLEAEMIDDIEDRTEI